MDIVNQALKDGIFIEKETDENIIAMIDAAPQGKVPHPVFLDFYAKYDKYFGEEDDKRILDGFGLQHILVNLLNLPDEDVEIVMGHYEIEDGNLNNIQWYEKHDNEENKDEDWNIPGFDDSKDSVEAVMQYRRDQLKENDEPFTVYCDMDGVLCDFDLQFKELTNGISPKEYKAEHGVDGFWKIITDQGEKFWSEMPWTPEGKKLWSYIKKYNPILLSAPSNDSSSRIGKRQWVDKNLPGVTLKLASKANKPDYATNDKDVLIDDFYGTIVDWKNKGSIGIWYNSYSSAIRQLQKAGL